MTTRVYVPATTGSLATLHSTGSLLVPVATAVTATLRAALPGMDEEELELEALLDAAELSLTLVRADAAVARRRVVVAADVGPSALTPAPDVGVSAVRLTEPVTLDSVASVHVDEPAAAAVVATADVADVDLLWYAPQEIEDLLGR